MPLNAALGGAVTSLQSLVAELRLAFHGSPFQGVAAAHDCLECDELRHFLKGKSWRDLDSEALWEIELALLTPEAYHAFLPAWLWHGLHDPESAHAAMALINMQATDHMGAFSTQERNLLVRCAQFINASDPFASEDSESIARLRQVEERWGQ